MTGMHLKKPLYHSLTNFVKGTIDLHENLRGKILPAEVVAVTGAIVTVSFPIQTDTPYPIVEMPIAYSNYFSGATQIGDIGIAIPVDFGISGMTGLGTGTGGQPAGNLGAMVFFPIGSLLSPTYPTGITAVMGPSGVTLTDALGDMVMTLGPLGVTMAPSPANTAAILTFSVGTTSIAVTNGSITLTVGSVAILINSSGVTINGIPFMTHTHSGVTTGSSNTGVVV